MKNIIKAIREYLTLRKMIKQKEDALFETIWDIEFFRQCKSKYIDMTIQDEKDIRAELQEELKKGENEIDKNKVRRLSVDLEEYKKVQSLYTISKRTRDELGAYLNLLKHGNKK